MIEIKNLERNVADGGVTVIHYGITVVDGEYSASSYGTVSVTPDPSDAGFVPFDSLTSDVVEGWVANALDVAAIEAQLQANIEEQKAPSSVSGMPW